MFNEVMLNVIKSFIQCCFIKAIDCSSLHLSFGVTILVMSICDEQNNYCFFFREEVLLLELLQQICKHIHIRQEEHLEYKIWNHKTWI